MSSDQQQQIQQQWALLQRITAAQQPAGAPYHTTAPLPAIASGSTALEDERDSQTKRHAYKAKVWDGFIEEIAKDGLKTTHEFPLARIRKIMKSDEDVKVRHQNAFLRNSFLDSQLHKFRSHPIYVDEKSFFDIFLLVFHCSKPLPGILRTLLLKRGFRTLDV
jgi:hypothetical protein